MKAHERIGDYEILNELGSGGMGRVFRVRNVLSDRIEAMKVLLPDLIGRQDLAARFLREIRVLAALIHPNIATLRTALTIDNQLVMIMEYVEGQSLAARLQHGPIAVDEAMKYLEQALDALGYAHGQHVIHRDIKPANMMLTSQGIVKLTDFGIARAAGDQTLTVAGTTTGSLSYMPPEQVNGDPTDARSDVYSAGISLYEMVTGRRPFEANSDFGVMLAHLKEQPRPPIEVQPGLPAGLNDVILQAITKNPADRFQSAYEFRDALRQLSIARPGVAVSPDATVIANSAAPVSSNATTRLATPDTLGTAGPRTADYQRTVLDTGVPVASGGSASRTGGPPPPVVQQQRKGVHAGVYIALGAVLVIAAVAGTGVYLRQAEAGSDQAAEAPAAAAPAVDTTAAETPTDGAASAPADAGSPPPHAATPPASSAGATAAASGDRATPPAASGDAAPRDARSERATQTTGSPDPVAPPVRSAAPSGDRRPPVRATESARAPAAGPDVPKQEEAPVEHAKPAPSPQDAALDELEDEIDQLSVRAAAVNSSLDRLQQEQARQGFGLRGDIVARQESMKLNLARAQDAIERSDAARAGKYKEQVERDVQALETFLGR